MSDWKATRFLVLILGGLALGSCGEESEKSDCKKACGRIFELCGDSAKNEYGNVGNCAADCEDDSDGATGTPEELSCVLRTNSCSDLSICFK